MVSATNLIKIIEHAPLLLEWFVPGFIFFVIIKRMTNFEISENKVYESVAIVMCSGVLRSILRSFPYLVLNEFGYLLWTIVITIILAFFISWLYRNRTVNKKFTEQFIKGFHNNIWEDVPDYRTHPNIRLTMRNGDLIGGKISVIEEKGDESWIAIDVYQILENGCSTPVGYADFEKPGQHSFVMVRMADVKSVIVINNPAKPKIP